VAAGRTFRPLGEVRPRPSHSFFLLPCGGYLTFCPCPVRPSYLSPVLDSGRRHSHGPAFRALYLFPLRNSAGGACSFAVFFFVGFGFYPLRSAALTFVLATHHYRIRPRALFFSVLTRETMYLDPLRMCSEFRDCKPFRSWHVPPPSRNEGFFANPHPHFPHPLISKPSLSFRPAQFLNHAPPNLSCPADTPSMDSLTEPR